MDGKLPEAVGSPVVRVNAPQKMKQMCETEHADATKEVVANDEDLLQLDAKSGSWDSTQYQTRVISPAACSIWQWAGG
jgi:hypothetical protein